MGLGDIHEHLFFEANPVQGAIISAFIKIKHGPPERIHFR